jgi:hypothetical protein
MQNLAQIFFVMWRETVEAMLVVGILHAWLSHNPQGKPGIKYLWMGVLAGLGGAFLRSARSSRTGGAWPHWRPSPWRARAARRWSF